MNRMVGLIVALVVAGGALAFISMGNLGENLVYYWSPTEMGSHGSEAVGATIRLGGQVVPGSIVPGSGAGTPLRFKVTDGTTEVAVQTTEIPPAMFRVGMGVVVEGTVDRAGTFSSNRMMVKHDNEYRAPKPGDVVDQAKMKQEMEQMFVDNAGGGAGGGAGGAGSQAGGGQAGGGQ